MNSKILPSRNFLIVVRSKLLDLSKKMKKKDILKITYSKDISETYTSIRILSIKMKSHS